MGLLLPDHHWNFPLKVHRLLRRILPARNAKAFDPSGFPLSVPKAWHKILRSWMTYPSELLACLTFLSFHLLFWQAEHRKAGVVWGLPLTLGIWFSTVYLGFHYFPDLVAGGVLGGLAVLSAPLLEERFHRLKNSLGGFS